MSGQTLSNTKTLRAKASKVLVTIPAASRGQLEILQAQRQRQADNSDSRRLAARRLHCLLPMQNMTPAMRSPCSLEEGILPQVCRRRSNEGRQRWLMGRAGPALSNAQPPTCSGIAVQERRCRQGQGQAAGSSEPSNHFLRRSL